MFFIRLNEPKFIANLEVNLIIFVMQVHFIIR